MMALRSASNVHRGSHDVSVRFISLHEGDRVRDTVLSSMSNEWKVSHRRDVSIFHVGGFVSGKLVTCVSFVQEHSELPSSLEIWRLRAMATLPECRGKGIGGRVLEFGVREVALRGGTLVWCEGRVIARRFYERFSFCAIGPEFENRGTGRHRILVRPVVERDRQPALVDGQRRQWNANIQDGGAP